MRICLLTDSPEPSGVGRHMLDLAVGLATRHEVLMVAGEGRGPAEVLAAAAAQGIETFTRPLRDPDRPEAGGPTPWQPDWLPGWVVEQRIDVLHIHAGISWEGHPPALAAAEVPRVAIVRTEHLPFLLTKPVDISEWRAGLEPVDVVIAVSACAGASLIAGGLPAERLTVVRNGSEPPRGLLAAGAARPRPTHPPVLLTPARFTTQKGHDVLVQAIPWVLAGIPDARFVWIGRGPERDDVMAEVNRRGIADNVELREPGRDLAEAYAEATAIVLPSRFEGLPLVVLEAMGLRIPIVATRVCGTVEALDDDTGWLVPAEDPSALAAAIVAMLRHPEDVAGRIERAHERWLADFRTARMVSATEVVYESARAKLSRV